MAERVLYVLGAGFSAPIGLPTMGDFLIKAKDLYFVHPEKLDYFQEVFEQLNSLAKAKNYFSCDLFNIEEVLSILEMNKVLSDSEDTKTFSRFICDVVRYSTPDAASLGERRVANWAQGLFGELGTWRSYTLFVANLLRAKLDLNTGSANHYLSWSINDSIDIRYSAITFNYDLIIETSVARLSHSYLNGDILGKPSEPNDVFRYIKLHGSLNDGDIIPPTWNKGIHAKITDQWKFAFSLMKEAQHIRFIGYSLPVSDSYARYLFKSALLASSHLKSIDVITLDSDHNTEARYRELFNFKYFRFKSVSWETYLKQLESTQLIQAQSLPMPHKSYKFDFLEKVHEAIMQS